MSLFAAVVSRMIRARKASACDVVDSSYPALQFLQLLIRPFWNLPRVMVRHFGPPSYG